MKKETDVASSVRPETKPLPRVISITFLLVILMLCNTVVMRITDIITRDEFA